MGSLDYLATKCIYAPLLLYSLAMDVLHCDCFPSCNKGEFSEYKPTHTKEKSPEVRSPEFKKVIFYIGGDGPNNESEYSATKLT